MDNYISGLLLGLFIGVICAHIDLYRQEKRIRKEYEAKQKADD